MYYNMVVVDLWLLVTQLRYYFELVCLLWSKLACAFVIISYYQTWECVVD
jgi:hypothetical protein